MLSILGSMQLCSRALYILAAMDMCYTSVVLGNPRSPFLGEGKYTSLHPFLYRILIISGITVSEQYVVEFSGLPYFWGHFIVLKHTHKEFDKTKKRRKAIMKKNDEKIEI